MIHAEGPLTIDQVKGQWLLDNAAHPPTFGDPDRIAREAAIEYRKQLILSGVFDREAEKVWRNPLLAPVGDVPRPGKARLRIAVVTQGIGRDSSPEVRELTLRTAALLEGLGHHVEEIDNPVPASFTFFGSPLPVCGASTRWYSPPSSE